MPGCLVSTTKIAPPPTVDVKSSRVSIAKSLSSSRRFAAKMPPVADWPSTLARVTSRRCA